MSRVSIASVNGRITPSEEALIPVTDDGLLRGDGGFEVLRLYGGRPYAVAEHAARLTRTCEGLKLDADIEALVAESEALVGEAGPVDALLRWVVTRGGRRIAIVEPLPARKQELRVLPMPYSPSIVLDRLKTLSYAANMLAGRIAREQGFDEALFVDGEGTVLEGPTWTFFWVREGRIHTPPLAQPILASITRARVLEECEVVELDCSAGELAAADEAFAASTVREVTPIVAIGQRSLAAGPVTAQARERLLSRIARDLSLEAVA
jgi:branched-chain amino acid aminotransferase